MGQAWAGLVQRVRLCLAFLVFKPVGSGRHDRARDLVLWYQAVNDFVISLSKRAAHRFWVLLHLCRWTRSYHYRVSLLYRTFGFPHGAS